MEIRTESKKVRNGLVIAGLIGLAAISLTFVGQAKAAAPAATTAVSLNASSWNILYSVDMPAHPTALSTGGWFFDFPVYTGVLSDCAATVTCPGIHYLTTAYTAPLATTNSLSITLQVDTTGTPVFNYALKSDNTCISPAHVRLYMERKKNPNSEYSRWWANPTSYELAAGSVTMTVPLTPDQWSDVNGRFGNADSTATSNFRQAIQSLGSIGMTFGGGCFFGHGVNVSGGTARFIVTDFSVR